MSRRRLSDDEWALWKGFARGVTPLRRDAGEELDSPPDQPARRQTPQPLQSVRQDRPTAKQPATPMQFDRRLRQRVARGGTAIDARLDLHGMTQNQAHAALLRFLARAQAQDAKLALVVTGKGSGRAAGSASERGVLRRQVPLWLSLPEFRRFIVGFDQAHISHGGEGALYLRLRRRPR
jgi:DNA-nicking Smr family endonuclease